MDESLASLPTSHLLGSVPAVVSEEKKTTAYEAPGANMQIFPPNNGASGGRGYQTIENSNGFEQQPPPGGWKGTFSVSSYTQYFDVDTDLVLNRMISSLYPTNGDFFSRIDANPDLYGLVWISTTLMFLIGSLGNCATYLMNKRRDSKTMWDFDVNYLNTAAWSIYGYSIVVPLGFYFLLQYMGSNSRLVHFWCMWGYSLFIFVLSSFLMVIPLEFIRWTIIIGAGVASASFVTLNLRSHIQGNNNDLQVVLVAAFLLQMSLAIFIKMYFFA